MMTRALAILIAVAGLVSVAPAQSSLVTTATVLRTTATLTTSDVLSTATLPARVKAVLFYVDFDKGAATSGAFTPVGAIDANPAATGYYKLLGYAKTLTASDQYVIRVPREDFGAYQYYGIASIGVGTLTSTGARVWVKYEY